MTNEEALLYLPENEEESLDDRFEEAVFEIKQFLNTKMPVSKLIASKLKKLKLIEEAFVTLGGVLSSAELPSVSSHLQEEKLRGVFDEYTRKRGDLKLQLLAQQTVSGIEAVMNGLIELTMEYVEHWSLVEVSEIADVPMGNEPDPMEILSAINEMESNGWTSFTEINLIEGNSPLKTEAKRLSLWLKFEENGR